MAAEDNIISTNVELTIYDKGRKVRFKSGSDISGKINLNVQKPTLPNGEVIVELTFES
ncbi:MAG: hypothetical protein KJ941_07625 [Bacteroidetes bacterium]|nr:hypothetical protein [Bacteroidota bacterium]